MQQSSEEAFRNWREALWETYARLESATGDAAFFGRVLQPLPASQTLSTVSSTAQRTERTLGNIRADPQEFVLCAFQLRGQGFAEQGERRAVTTPGELVLYETVRPYTLIFEGPFEQLVLKLPRHLLQQRLSGLSHMTGRPLSMERGAGAVARDFIVNLAKRGSELSIADVDALIPVAAELIANAVAGQLSDLPIDYVRFERIRQRLREISREPRPDLDQLARAEGMSPRTLQRLLQLNGTTAGRIILEARLEGVMRDLQVRKCRPRQIGDIALSWGFNDLSYFTRAFRTRFGTSPGENRRTELSGGKHCDVAPLIGW